MKTRTVFGVTLGGLALLLGANATAEEGKEESPEEVKGEEMVKRVPICTKMVSVSASLFNEEFNNTKMAYELFKRPNRYAGLSGDELEAKLWDGLQERMSASRGRMDKVQKRKILPVKENLADVRRFSAEIDQKTVDYVVAFTDYVRDKILDLDQRSAHSERMARGFISTIAKSISQRPILAKVFNPQYDGLPLCTYPTPFGVTDDCLGYKAFVASLEKLTQTPMDALRKYSPLLNSLAVTNSSCAGDIDEAPAKYSAADEDQLRRWLKRNRGNYVGVACGSVDDLEKWKEQAVVNSIAVRLPKGETIVAHEGKIGAFGEFKIESSAGRKYHAPFLGDIEVVQEKGTACAASQSPRFIQEVK